MKMEILLMKVKVMRNRVYNNLIKLRNMLEF